MDESNINQLKGSYQEIKQDIEKRLQEFAELWEKGSEDRIFEEMVFCLFTPQSKAKVCWETVKNLRDENRLINAEHKELSDRIKRVRFRNNKARYVIEAREKFIENDEVSLKEKISNFSDPYDAREWLVDNVKGLGYKEASHFLRNIGKGDDLAILDRHILRNMSRLNVIEKVPENLNKKRYLIIEERLREFADHIDIPLQHLDLLLWYRETGEIFK